MTSRILAKNHDPLLQEKYCIRYSKVGRFGILNSICEAILGILYRSIIVIYMFLHEEHIEYKMNAT